MAGPFHLYASNDAELAGDTTLSEQMKYRADLVGGYVKDMGTGQVVYPAPTAEEQHDAIPS